MGRFIPNENTWVGFTVVPPGSVGVPTISAVTVNDTTGGIPASTALSYRVVAKTSAGHGLPSAAHTGATSSSGAGHEATVTWAAVPGESAGYDVYGRTDGSPEKLIGSVGHGVLTFTDDGTVTPSGRLPTANTSAVLDSPTVADIENAIDLTDYLMSLNASATGNAVPTPSFSSLFETSIIGTSQATFTADFYRDDEDDLAWLLLPRGTKGWFYISRYGGKPGLGDALETWPTNVMSRAMANMANNTPESFTSTCSVPKEPAEDAVVVATPT